jgi:hypothetical protein
MTLLFSLRFLTVLSKISQKILGFEYNQSKILVQEIFQREQRTHSETLTSTSESLFLLTRAHSNQNDIVRCKSEATINSNGIEFKQIRDEQ